MVLLILFVCLQFSTILAQQPKTDQTELKAFIDEVADLELQAAITNYTYDLFLQHGEGKIGEEKFLISLMELINQEMSSRLTDPKAARKRYFEDLEAKLNEVYTFKQRIRNSGNADLLQFADELSQRIKQTIEIGVIDFKKKKVFEDAIQMLYVSEEMAKLEDARSNNLGQQINRSRDEILAAFGEAAKKNEVVNNFGRPVTIYDLFVAWKQTENIKYEQRLLDVQLIRRNFLDSGTQDERLRMINSELKLAYNMFNYADFELSERLLKDVLETYPKYGFTQFDDVYYYLAESHFAKNELLHARDTYVQLLSKYPGSEFADEAYHRLIQLNYNLKNYGDVVDAYEKSQTVLSTNAAEYADVPFLVAMAYYELNDSNRAVDLLMTITPTNPYYYTARYFLGNTSVDAGQDAQAEQVYLSLVNDNSTPAHIRNRAYYKLGLLKFQQKDYAGAIQFLNQVALNFERYDKVLNALAWTYFEQENSKEIGSYRDYRQAVHYANRLLSEYYASPFRMEAQGLLAYINQITENPTAAVQNYREIYQEKVNKKPIDQLLDEQYQLETLHQQAVRLKEKALQNNDKNAFLKAQALEERLKEKIDALDLAEANPTGVAMMKEAEEVVRQIKEINRLRLMAEESGNKKAIKKLDSLQVRLSVVLESFPKEIFTSSGYLNLYDEYPVGKFVAEKEQQYDVMLAQFEQINKELAQIDQLIGNIDNAIVKAKNERDFSKVARLEIKRRNLLNLKKRYDQLYTVINSEDMKKNPYPDFDRWGDLGAFGIISVYFDQKQAKQAELSQVSAVLEEVNQAIEQRKQVIEDKIKKIEAEIRLMTMRARREERNRLRAERERAFRESYFDTRESEIPEEDVIPNQEQ
jgi:TolA-binding protein